MPRLSREESQERTRERLLEAAAAVFARAGYGGASVDAISEAAGFSKGAFYSNFDTKEAIFLELLSRHMARELTASEALVRDGETLDVVIDRIAERYASDPHDQEWCMLSIEFALQAARSPDFAARHDALYDRQYRGIGEIVAELAKLAGVKLAAPLNVAVAFIAFRQGLALDRSGLAPRLSKAEAKMTLRQFMLGLLGRPQI